MKIIHKTADQKYCFLLDTLAELLIFSSSVTDFTSFRSTEIIMIEVVFVPYLRTLCFV